MSLNIVLSLVLDEDRLRLLQFNARICGQIHYENGICGQIHYGLG